MAEKPYFITTPIYYVNDVPHIGHAYTTVAADVYSRFMRESGKNVAFLVGTDEHGAKVAEAAAKNNQEPQAYTDSIHQVFKHAWEAMGIQHDYFIRTTDPEHLKTVSGFVQKIYDAGFVKKGVYEGLYCVGCEKFKSPDELADGKCADHNRIAEPYREENYFFELSKFEKDLTARIDSDRIEIRPLERKREILGKLAQGLQDISISRAQVMWGVPLPFDNSQTIYVWIDALINYYTYGKPRGLWPADLHLVGKDILWFHSVIWPAMLMAIGEEPPKKIFAHGFFTIGGSKMSKTIGNVITPQELIDKFGVDASRYLLMSAFPFGTDGDFDWARLTEKYNADLANGIGNLTARIVTLAAGVEGLTLDIEQGLNMEIRSYRDRFHASMAALDFYGAANILQELIKRADRYLNEEKPWMLEGEKKRRALQNLVGMLALSAAVSRPFMPAAAARIFGQLGIQGEREEWGKTILTAVKGEALFPRIE